MTGISPDIVSVQPTYLEEHPGYAWAPPITQQPMGGQGKCFPGLEHLESLDSFKVAQVINMTEVVTGLQAQAKTYLVLNDKNEVCYRVEEESGLGMRLWFPAIRDFVMHIKDSSNNDVLLIRRDFRACIMGCCCCDCCSNRTQAISIRLPSNQEIGAVVELPAFFSNEFSIKDENGEEVAKIVAPSCMPLNCCNACCQTVHFKIVRPNGEQIGDISREWMGFWVHAVTTADTFTINLSSTLDGRVKALILGAIFLIDFRWFEHPKQRGRQPPVGN